MALVRARLPALPFPPRGFDAVAANSLLHHLPDPAVFWSEAARVARPGAALLVVDLLRPDSIEQARSIVDRYAAGEDELLRRDFYHSLRAAFIPAEVERQLGTPLGSRLACSAVSDRHWAVTGHF